MSPRWPALLILVLVLGGRCEPVLAQTPASPGPVVDARGAVTGVNTTRLFYAPTARSLPKGQVYLGAYAVVIPFMQVGVTDRFSIGGGTPLLFGMDDFEQPFWITPKLQVINTGRTQIAVGAFHAFADGHSGGLGYGVVTTGSEDASVTIGAGMTYAIDGPDVAIVMVGGEKRILRNIKLVTENYIWRGGEGTVIGGLRFLWRRLSADVGVAVPVGMSSIAVFPIFNVAYTF
jgi:hypothetical protein